MTEADGKTGLLLEEIRQKMTGRYLEPYYRGVGVKKSALAGESPAVREARGFASAVTMPEPYLYRNDVIAGSIRNLAGEVEEAAFQEAAEALQGMNRRTFGTNSDHFSADFRKLVSLGIPGIRREIRESLERHAGEPEKTDYLRSLEIALDGFSDMISGYARKAEELGKTEAEKQEPDREYLERLAGIGETCRALVCHAPETFEQGLTLVNMCYKAFCLDGRYAMALGRMDQYLFPLYEKDRILGRMDREKATGLLENVFAKIHERFVLTGADDVVNIAIGGRNMEGGCDVNELSFAVLNAVRNCSIPGPNLSARISSNCPDDFLDACLEVIGTGLGYPALMCDETNIMALLRMGYEPADVYDYTMVGCIENFITGKQPPWSDGRFDAPRLLLSALNSPKAGEISSMEDLLRLTEEELKAAVKQYADGFNGFNRFPGEEQSFTPFLSVLCDDCIARGQDINLGGSKYPSVHGAALMGVGTMSDSLAAVEQVVFREGKVTLAELTAALQANFVGYEELREALLAAPKYGNNDDRADKYAVWFTDFLSKEFDRYRTKDGGRFYVLMAANVSNIYAGKTIGATPDGRLAGQPLSDAASPTYGRDVRGATAAVNSLTKPDYGLVAGGSVINQKFSPSMFRGEKRKKLLTLIRTYFAKGGQEMQINATSPEVLRDAMDHPEKYPSMVVRVSGFSAVYVTLAREVQEDILARTQQE